MGDMLVKLYQLESDYFLEDRLLQDGIRIKKALAPDRSKVIAFVKSNFEEYVDERSSWRKFDRGELLRSL